jgi:hypothetical protein
MPDWRPLKGYSEADHAERLRVILRKRIDALPLKALVKLQEAAALLAAGERLDLLLVRDRVGKKGAVQIQPRENLDRGQRTTAATSVENAALEDEARAKIVAAVAARRSRFTQLTDGAR